VPTISQRLHYGQSQTPVLEIIPDPTGLYRIAWPDIGLSDLAVSPARDPRSRDCCRYQDDYSDRSHPGRPIPAALNRKAEQEWQRPEKDNDVA